VLTGAQSYGLDRRNRSYLQKTLSLHSRQGTFFFFVGLSDFCLGLFVVTSQTFGPTLFGAPTKLIGPIPPFAERAL